MRSRTAGGGLSAMPPLLLASAAAAVFLAAGAGPFRFFRRSFLPWTHLALFAAALFASFVAALALGGPLLARAHALLGDPVGPLAARLEGVPAPLVRLGLFIPICGGISLVCLKALTHTRFLNFLPDRLVWNAAVMVTAALLLFALTGA